MGAPRGLRAGKRGSGGQGRRGPRRFSMRPEPPTSGLLSLLEEAAWSAGLPGAGRIAAEAVAAGYAAATLPGQWEILHGLLAEHLAEAADPAAAAAELFRAASPRARFFLPGAWWRVARDGPPAPALTRLREWARGADEGLGDALPSFGLRPWAAALGEEILPYLLPWTVDPDPEVRRAAVVALRPRGAWVAQLSWAVEQPSLLVPLFDALRGERDPRVAGALGNALNDVARGSPQLALELLHRWREEDAGPLLGAIARRGLRGLVKEGDPRALRALGLPALRIEARAQLRGGGVVAPNSSLVFELRVRNFGEAGPAQLVYEIETPGKSAARPRRQRVQGGVYRLPAGDEVGLLVRERIFDRRSAPLLDGEGRVRFFLNGEPCAEAAFRIERG